MTVDITALNTLFPPRATAAGPVVAVTGTTGSGPFPYDAIRANGCPGLDPLLIKVIEDVRSDQKWGPVYRGDLTSYGNDWSAADLALCGKFLRSGLSVAMTDTAMRSSALYRPKWERADYRQRTVHLALESARGSMQPQPPLSLMTAVVPAGRTPPPLPRVSVPLLAPKNGQVNAGTTPPPPRMWLIDEMLLTGKSAVLAGLSGVSKTQLAILAAISIATGSDFGGRKARIGKVMLLSGEEDRLELQRRINAEIRHSALTPNAVDLVRENLRAYPLVGEDIRLSRREGGVLKETTFATEIVTAAITLGDVRVIMIDHAGLAHGGDFNAKEDAALTMRIINDIANKTGAAVILLAHSPKGAIKAEESDASMIFGSSAFIEQARGGWILATMTTDKAKHFGIPDASRRDYVALTGVKANYTRDGQELWFRRVSFDEVGVLEHVILAPPIKNTKGIVTLEGHVLQTVVASPGRYSKTKLRDQFQGKSAGPWNASKAEIEACVDGLLQRGQLMNRAPTDNERRCYSHGPQVKHVLDTAISTGAVP